MIDFKNENYWCDKFGKVILQNKTNSKIFAERSYHWVNSVILIDETKDTRNIIGFESEESFHPNDWKIIDPIQEKYIKNLFSEIDQIRRNLKLNFLLKINEEKSI
jgi:hypothetical protein